MGVALIVSTFIYIYLIYTYIYVYTYFIFILLIVYRLLPVVYTAWAERLQPVRATQGALAGSEAASGLQAGNKYACIHISVYTQITIYWGFPGPEQQRNWGTDKGTNAFLYYF